MKKLTLLLTTCVFSLTMFSSKADAGWKEKLSSAGFAYCLKENDFDHDTQLWAYNPKTNQTEYLERNASICKGKIILKIVLADIYQTVIFGAGVDMARSFVFLGALWVQKQRANHIVTEFISLIQYLTKRSQSLHLIHQLKFHH